MRAIGLWARLCAFCAILVVAALSAGPSQAADSYPVRKVRVIVPFAAGGPTDVIARMVAERLSEAWGQQLYVENTRRAGRLYDPGRLDRLHHQSEHVLKDRL